jgi:uracil-DNA glycosylase family 4
MKIPIYDEEDKVTLEKTILDRDCSPTDNIDIADIAIVGKSPNTYEIRLDTPFHGQNGDKLRNLLSMISISTYNTYFTYACKTQLVEKPKVSAPYFNGEPLWTKKSEHDDLPKLREKLINELSNFKGKLIILMGNFAMRLLLGDPKLDSIKKHRGSIYKADEFTHLADKLAGKYIGITYNMDETSPKKQPQSKASNFYIILADISKFVKFAKNPVLPKINFIIEPNFSYIRKFILDSYKSSEVAFDIECTPKFITCFSLAYRDIHNTIHSMCVPLMNNDGNYWEEETEIRIWFLLAALLQDPKVKIICQNGMFDITYILRAMNIITDNFHFDTLIAQNITYPDFPKGLDFLTSIYTCFPYYKDDGKLDHDTLQKDWYTYWVYNAKDSAYLFPIKDALEEELKEINAEHTMQHSMELHAPLIEMQYNGILVNNKGLQKAKKNYQNRYKAIEHGLHKLVGYELNHGSSKQMIAYFYGVKQIKPYLNLKTKRPTCDFKSLSRIARRKISGSVEAKMIMKLRKYGTNLTRYFVDNTDKDNKLRCTYNIAGTNSGRLSSNSTFFGTGTNLQNQPYLIKQFLIADDEHYLIEVDLAKAEAHIVAFITEDGAMMEIFKSGKDVHSYNSSLIFKCSMEEIKAEKRVIGKLTKRDLGKRVVHATNYDISPQGLSDSLAKDGYFYTQGECAKLLTAYKERSPALKNWQKKIKAEVEATRTLHNLYGRPKKFRGVMNSHLFRSAYSYIPQSTVGELLNRGMVSISKDRFFMYPNHKINLLATVHDSILFQVPVAYKNILTEILERIKKHLTHTFVYNGREFTIGLDAKIGTQWANNIYDIESFHPNNIKKAINKIKDYQVLTL